MSDVIPPPPPPTPQFDPVEVTNPPDISRHPFASDALYKLPVIVKFVEDAFVNVDAVVLVATKYAAFKKSVDVAVSRPPFTTRK